MPLNRDRRAIDTAILANANLPHPKRKKAKELAAEFGVKLQVIYDQTNRLRQRGLMPKVPGREDSVGGTDTLLRNQSTPGKKVETGPAIDPDVLLTKVMNGEIVDSAERRRVLSIIIALGSDQNKLTAIKLLEDFERAKDDVYGPKEPATPEERHRRLTRIMLAAGREDCEKAFTAAFGGQNVETAVEQTQN